MEKLPLTGLVVGSVTAAVVVCGDPDRATKVAASLAAAEALDTQRGYRAYRGTFAGTGVTVCAHGIGAPGAAIAFEELVAAGGRFFIRVGSCGGLQPGMASGELVIATAAVQNTGYGRETVPQGYPAVANLELTLALQEAATASGRSFQSGIVLSRDNFYAGVDTPHTPHYQTLSQANVLAVEMECAALFIVGTLRRVATAAILAVDGNVLQSGESMESYRPHRDVVQRAIEAEIEIALRALHSFENDDT